MGIEDWEIQYDQSASRRLFRELCLKHFSMNGFIEHLRAEHAPALARLQLEIDIGELDAGQLRESDTLSIAEHYFIQRMIDLGTQSAFYSVPREPWLKAAALEYFGTPRDYFHNLFIELPQGLQCDPDVIQAAIRSDRSHLFYIEPDMLVAHAGEVFLTMPGRFTHYFRVDAPDVDFIVSLLEQKPSLRDAITEAGREQRLPEHWPALREEINRALVGKGMPELQDKPVPRLERWKKVLQETFTPGS